MHRIRRCDKCGKYPTKLVHECRVYHVIRDKNTHKLYAETPEHAVERVSEYFQKEIYCSIGNQEYISEEAGGGKYIAYIIFDGDTSVKTRISEVV
jgi:hypothetical protein